MDKESNVESEIIENHKNDLTNDDETDNCAKHDKKNIHDVSTGNIEWKHCDYKNIFSTELENTEEDIGSEVKDEKGTILFEKQKLYQSATAAYMSGQFSSLRSAAKHFGVPRTSLYRLVVDQKMFQGRGRRSKVFTEEEEIGLGREALKETNDGKDLTWPKLSEILQKKLE